MSLSSKALIVTRLSLVIVISSIITGCGGGGGEATNSSSGASTITSNTPSNSNPKVPVNLSQISVDFSKAIDPNSLNSNSFTVSGGATGTVSTANNNTRVIFTLNQELSGNITYTVTLDGVTDVSGNSVTGSTDPFSWSFSTCGYNASSSHTINWDTVNDPDIVGYRVYYGTNSPLTKSNSSSQDVGVVSSWDLTPSSYDFLPCNNVYVAVSSLGGTKGESSLSDSVSAVIE